jgi:CARDB protein
MRRLVITAALLVSALAPAAASAAPVGNARLVSCVSALDPADRAATFEGRMRTVRGTVRMQMRFTLQTRGKDQIHWHALAAPGFGRWLSSDPGIGRYVYTKRVVALEAPASYRTVVRFRWLGRAGRRVASDRSTSPTCHQADYRPNLRPLGIDERPGADSEHARYVVPVTNRGKTVAAPFDVVVTVDGATLTPAQSPELAPGERALVEVQGPPCTAGSMLTVDVDPTGAVDERDEEDNRISVPCPPAPA